MAILSPSGGHPATLADEATIRRRYQTLADALRRKAFGEVSLLAIHSYRSAGKNEAPILFSKTLPHLVRAASALVYRTYVFKIGFLKIKGSEARVQSIETGKRFRVANGKRYRETLWAVRRDLWTKTGGRWLLAATYFPEGYRIYFDHPPKTKPPSTVTH